MNSKAKKKPGSIVLSIISVILAAIFMTPILWSLAVSFQKEGKQINSILDWFTPVSYTHLDVYKRQVKRLLH